MNEHNIPCADDENDWHTAEDIRLLAQLAALFHDFGEAFQHKLSRVLLSSATLPPALVQGLFQAYRKGREEYQRNRRVSRLMRLPFDVAQDRLCRHILCRLQPFVIFALFK